MTKPPTRAESTKEQLTKIAKYVVLNRDTRAYVKLCLEIAFIDGCRWGNYQAYQTIPRRRKRGGTR